MFSFLAINLSLLLLFSKALAQNDIDSTSPEIITCYRCNAEYNSNGQYIAGDGSGCLDTTQLDTSKYTCQISSSKYCTEMIKYDEHGAMLEIIRGCNSFLVNQLISENNGDNELNDGDSVCVDDDVEVQVESSDDDGDDVTPSTTTQTIKTSQCVSICNNDFCNNNIPGQNEESSLSGGQIAGIVIGCVLFGLLVAILIIYLVKLEQRKETPETEKLQEGINRDNNHNNHNDFNSGRKEAGLVSQSEETKQESIHKNNHSVKVDVHKSNEKTSIRSPGSSRQVRKNRSSKTSFSNEGGYV